jgi:hypothetical protein
MTLSQFQSPPTTSSSSSEAAAEQEQQQEEECEYEPPLSKNHLLPYSRYFDNDTAFHGYYCGDDFWVHHIVKPRNWALASELWEHLANVFEREKATSRRTDWGRHTLVMPMLKIFWGRLLWLQQNGGLTRQTRVAAGCTLRI